MKNIQWFPGHMAKAMRDITENAKISDGVVYVLDARAPFSCINPKLSDIFSGKPVLYLLNKSDLISSGDLGKIVAKFKEKGLVASGVVGNDKNSVLKGIKVLREMLAQKIEQKSAKGKVVRFSVVGVPNTGKSTILNTLAGSKKAVTGDKAGVTKNIQWIKLSDMEFADTPGTMPPYFDSREISVNLACIGAINDDILDKEEVCLELIGKLIKICPEKLGEKYGVTSNEPTVAYEQICAKRFLLKGGQPDYYRCALAVIDDFRKGRIGKICLE